MKDRPKDRPHDHDRPDRPPFDPAAYPAPLHGAPDPGNGGTTPGSFALRPEVEPGAGGARTFSSPD
ncbi:MAG: hypothetical protein PVG07_06615, partial [Acidobacteriota bacterium]